MKSIPNEDRFTRYLSLVNVLLAKESFEKPDIYKALREEQRPFRGKLTDYVRLYAFLSQILTFSDPDLEKLYVFARLLRRYLPVERDALPREVQQNIDMESYRHQQTWKGKIKLERGNGAVEPIGPKPGAGPGPEEIEPLSEIIKELNERFGTDFTEEDRVFIQNLEQKLAGDLALVVAIQANTPENARLAFDHVANDRLQDMVDANFRFYKRIKDDKDFGKFFLDWLFDRFRKSLGEGESREERRQS